MGNEIFLFQLRALKVSFDGSRGHSRIAERLLEAESILASLETQDVTSNRLLLLLLLRLCFCSAEVLLDPKLHNLAYQVEGNGLI